MTTPYKLTLTATELVALRSVLDYLEDEIEDMTISENKANHIGNSVEVLRDAVEKLNG